MNTQSPWNETNPPAATPAPVAAGTPTTDKTKLPMFCKVIAIIDVSMGGFTLMAAPMQLLSLVVLTEGDPLRKFIIPSILIALLVGGVSVLTNINVFYKKPAAVMLGYFNIAATLIGVIYIWVLLPSTLESQKIQMANTPNAGQMPAEMQDMMGMIAVGGNALTTVVRLTLVVFLFISLNKYKAWLAERGR